MSYQYHGTTDLIALPNRTVQTYPSGLVRVERSFVCRKDQVAKYRNTIKVNEPMPFDDGAPAIDGLYIFPEPQELVRDDGFVEFRVTAYGRTNIFSNVSIKKSLIRNQYSLISFPPPGTSRELRQATPSSLNETYTIQGVLLTNQGASSILTKPNIQSPIVIPYSSGVGWSTDSETRINPPLVEGREFQFSAFSGEFGITFYWDEYKITILDILLDSFSSTNFGIWSEYSVTWIAGANVYNQYVIKETVQNT